MAPDHLPGGWLPPQAPGAEPQPQRPSFVRAPAEHGTNGLAIAAIVSGISSIALLVLSLGLSFPFSLPLGVTGWICAVRARVDVRAGQRKAGLVLAIAAVALSALAALVWIVLISTGYTVDELQRSLENELERQRRASG